MLAYAAARPVVAGRKSSPNAMLAIIGAHVAVVALVMSAKMELPPKFIDKPLIVDLIHSKKPPPPPNPLQPRASHQQSQETSYVPPQLPSHVSSGPSVEPFPTFPDSGPVGTLPRPSFPPLPMPKPVATGPELLTPLSELRPPYPASKLAAEQEATLTLRLTIDEHGRVAAVDPVGRVDSVFFEAARRYLIAHWRYRPATDGGRAIVSSVVITLKFQLDG